MLRRIFRSRTFWIACFLWIATPAPASPVDVGHPVYGFLRRLEIEGWITPGFLGSLPLPKSEVGRMLNEAAAKGDSLSDWEKNRLLAYRREFGFVASDEGRLHPLTYTDGDFNVGASADFNADVLILDSIPKAQTFGFGVLTGTLEGSYKEKFQFLSSAGLGQQRSLHPRFIENYDPQQGMPYNTDRAGKAGNPRTASSLDVFRTVAGYEDKAFRVEFGSDWNQWGPGIWQHASLSQKPWFWVQDSLPASDSLGFIGATDRRGYRLGYRKTGEAAPMTQLRMAARVGQFSYTKIIAERTGLWMDSIAHLIAHRLEYRPWSFLGLGIEEVVVTAGRPLDWTYIIPLVPLKYAEHQLGDRDNIALGMDAEVLINRHYRVFGELFLDDFSGYDMDFWGNKFAYSLGGEAVGFPFQSSVLQVEYARVEPWVYTHLLQDNQFQHFGSLVGSSIPLNSHAIRAAWEQPVGLDLDLRLEYDFMQRDVTSRGSSIFDYHFSANEGTRKVFLGGTVETRHAIMAGGTYRWRRFAELRLQAGYLAVDNWKSQAGSVLDAPLASIETTLHY